MKRVLAGLGLAFAVVACQPLYGGKPEKLHNPEKKKKPPEPPEQAQQIKYVDDCNADFRDDPKKARPQQQLARTLVDAGDTAMATADKAKDDQSKLGNILSAIDKYKNALVKDPYNIDATLKLAVTYDKVLRKGCALAMLKRLSSLSNYPKWTSEANRNIDTIDANGQWFKGYRKEAMAAVGR
jgi:hypothetical protein